jgi:protein phosphatase
MTETISIQAAGRTHAGLVRTRNEDSFYQGKWLYAVADGLGGHVAGDVASSTAILALQSCDRPVPTAELAAVLGRAVNDADEALRRRTRAEPELAGMGTTVVAMLLSGTGAVLTNVGDSRAYLVRDLGTPRSTMAQISEDHTYQHLLASASDVPHLPEKLARFLDGRKDGRSPDLTPLQLRPGDRVLLCSDGLSSYVPPDVVRATLVAVGEPGEIADRLIGLALESGGPDNVTVVVIDVHDG